MSWRRLDLFIATRAARTRGQPPGNGAEEDAEDAEEGKDANKTRQRMETNFLFFFPLSLVVEPPSTRTASPHQNPHPAAFPFGPDAAQRIQTRDERHETPREAETRDAAFEGDTR